MFAGLKMEGGVCMSSKALRADRRNAVIQNVYVLHELS